MLTDANLCLTRQRLAQFGLQLVVGHPEGWVRLDDTWGRGAENRLQVSHLGPASPLGGTQGSAQGGGVRNGQTKHRGAEDVGKNLGHRRILRGTARQEKLRGRGTDPSAVVTEAKRLAFDGSARKRSLGGGSSERNATRGTAGRDLGLLHRKYGGDGGGRSVDSGGKSNPVSVTAFAANGFAGE